MNQNNTGKALGVILAIPLALLVGFWVLTNPTGAISGLSMMSTAVIGLVALINPRLGLLLLVPQVLYVDEIKRLAVSYGVVSYSTVYEVLLGPILTLSLLNAGYLASVCLGQKKITRVALMWYACIFIGAGVFMATSTGTFSGRAQLVTNTCIYMTLIPLILAYFSDVEEGLKLLKWQIVWAIPSALWGIQQYYSGLSLMEIDYAKTGLSIVHYQQVLGFAEPRAFGFFGTTTAFAVVSIYGALSLFLLRKARSGRLGYFLMGAIYLWAIVASRQRTILAIIPMILVCSTMFYSPSRTLFFYFSGIALFVTGVIFSNSLLQGGLAKIDSAIQSENAWGRDVLRVGTFSDRLKGWTRLRKASTYSLLGTARASERADRVVLYTDEDYSHDAINSILKNAGVLGLLAVFAAVGTVLAALHRSVYRLKDKEQRRIACFLLATPAMVSFLSIAGGNILAVNPINLTIWTFLGTFMLAIQQRPPGKMDAA